MKYLISNKNCQVYKELYRLRLKEKKYNEENRKHVESVVGLNFDSYKGCPDQETALRVNSYIQFKFSDKSSVDLKTWTLAKDEAEFYRANTKTKLGREMLRKINEGIKCCSFINILDALKVPIVGNYKLPYLEIVDNVIIIELDDRQIPPDTSVLKISDNLFNEYYFKS